MYGIFDAEFESKICYILNNIMLTGKRIYYSVPLIEKDGIRRPEFFSIQQCDAHNHSMLRRALREVCTPDCMTKIITDKNVEFLDNWEFYG